MTTDVHPMPDRTGESAPTGAAPRPRRVHHGRGFWLLAYGFAVMMAFSAAPTPLYVLYQQRDGFGPFTVTLVFAAYAVGVVVSLFTVGHLSDQLGRRRLLLPALALNMLAGVVFLLPGIPVVPELLVARFISGISIGVLTATATAYLTELHAAARPGASRRRADLVGAAANIGGIGLGPLVAGLLAEYAPHPLATPFVVFEVLLTLGLVGAALLPETVSRVPLRYRPQRVAVPAASRRTYLAACATGFVSFAVFGLFTSLAPGFLVGTLHQRSHAVAGLVAFAVFASGVAGQVLTLRSALGRQLRVGLALLAAGLVALVAGVWLPSLALFVVGGVLSGAGAGAVFKGSVATVFSVAPTGARGEALAGLFLGGYGGLAVPVLGLGLATQHLSPRSALIGFAAVLLALLVVAVRPLLAKPRTDQ
ncbi:Predicted arabinose efflux permease, MFS family [Micromonospora krabiensis]|uniref:Predicted arabinose efflux permease, MFS family n=2 Tax=Micromonospora krabiensis TaxID=307121 RepID=A0A1C3N1A3_9ACTN|nr:Predicted arabinose efflux permease, MFS family [Micromonospora krabiensis]